MNALIVHGVEGYPEENWFPWVRKELELLGCNVFVPQFPTPKNQSLENWFKIFNEYKKHIDEDSIIIGHSMGAAFTLNILEKLGHKIKAAFLVAGFTGDCNHELNDLISPFSKRNFDWGKIKKNCNKFFIYNSDDDPYVSLMKGKELSKNLDSELILVKGAGHFNTDAGYTKFPLLLNNIKDLIKK